MRKRNYDHEVCGRLGAPQCISQIRHLYIPYMVSINYHVSSQNLLNYHVGWFRDNKTKCWRCADCVQNGFTIAIFESYYLYGNT